MSITFSSDAPEATTLVQEHCLCAQMAAGFGTTATPEALRAEANPRCLHCNGTGIESVPTSDGVFMNLSNANARALIQALRLGAPASLRSGEVFAGDDPSGSCTIHVARRAVIRARSGSVEQFARPEAIVYGKPRSEGNVVIARPLRSADPGLSADGLSDRIERFAALVEEAATRGATNIHWS